MGGRRRIFYPGDQAQLAMFAAVFAVLFVTCLIHNAGVFVMKRPILTLALASAFALGGCAFNPEKWAAATAQHGAGCFEQKVIKVRPLLVFGWPLPLGEYDYVMVCNAELAPTRAPTAPISSLPVLNYE